MVIDFEECFKKYVPAQCIVGTEWLFNYLEENIKPKVYLEIGCANLGAFYIYQHLLSDDGLAIGIDLPASDGRPIWKSYQPPNSSEFVLIERNSTFPETINQVREILGQRKIDFLFIDGWHGFNATNADWENYHGLVRSGGLVAFHDWDYMSIKERLLEIDNVLSCPNCREPVVDIEEDYCPECQGAAIVIDRLRKEGYKIFGVPTTSMGTALVRMP